MPHGAGPQEGQGYPIHSYIGGQQALVETLRQQKPARTHVGPVFKVRGRSVQKDRWDKHDQLWIGGGHMSLMAFVGEFSKRSNAALWSREANMVERGWGPESMRRSQHMQKLGKGQPPPKRRERGAWNAWHSSERGQWWQSDQDHWERWQQGAASSGAQGSGSSSSAAPKGAKGS